MLEITKNILGLQEVLLLQWFGSAGIMARLQQQIQWAWVSSPWFPSWSLYSSFQSAGQDPLFDPYL